MATSSCKRWPHLPTLLLFPVCHPLIPRWALSQGTISPTLFTLLGTLIRIDLSNNGALLYAREWGEVNRDVEVATCAYTCVVVF